MNFDFRVFGRRKPSNPMDAPAVTPAPAARPQKKKASFIAAAREILAAANTGPSALASRWQFVLQEANAGKR